MEDLDIVVSGLAAYREAEAGYVDGAWVERLDGLLLVSLGLPVPWANVAQVVGPVPEPARTLRTAWSRFAERGRAMSVQVAEGTADEVVAETGSLALRPQPPLVAMVRRGSRADTGPPGLDVSAVRTEPELAVLLDLQAEAFGMDRALLDRLHPVRALAERRLTLYLGRVEAEPLGSAESFVHDGVCGISGVCTLERARNRGIATAMTERAIAESGADVAWLLADERVASFYERMGFERRGLIRSYVPR